MAGRLPPRDPKTGRFRKGKNPHGRGPKRWNPAAKKPGVPRARGDRPAPRLTAAEKRELTAARRLSKQFHGTGAQVVELDRKERQLPRFAVVAGELDEFTYAPARQSKRGADKWRHQSGDRGPGWPRSPNRPLVIVDPKTRRPAIVAHRSPMRLDGKKGFIG